MLGRFEFDYSCGQRLHSRACKFALAGLVLVNRAEFILALHKWYSDVLALWEERVRG